MGFSEWIYALCIAELALLPVLLAILFLRRGWKKFPFFTAYVCCNCVGDTTLYFLLHNRAAYVYVYLVYETLAVSLALAVIYEVFTQIFSSHVALRTTAKFTFQLAGVVLVLLGMVVLYANGAIAQKGLVAAVLVVEEASRILEVGLIMFLFVFSTAFGLHWRHNVFGIALGLGIVAAVKLAAVTVGQHSYVTAGVVNMALMVASNLSILIWMTYLLVPDQASNSIELPKTAQLERWNQAIMELIHQ